MWTTTDLERRAQPLAIEEVSQCRPALVWFALGIFRCRHHAGAPLAAAPDSQQSATRAVRALVEKFRAYQGRPGRSDGRWSEKSPDSPRQASLQRTFDAREIELTGITVRRSGVGEESGAASVGDERGGLGKQVSLHRNGGRGDARCAGQRSGEWKVCKTFRAKRTASHLAAAANEEQRRNSFSGPGLDHGRAAQAEYTGRLCTTRIVRRSLSVYVRSCLAPTR